MRSLILSQCRDLRIDVTWQNLGALTTARARQSLAFYLVFLQHFLLSSSFNCFIVQSEYLLAILTANYWYMVTQPSTCLPLSDNTAGAITWWQHLLEEIRRNPIGRPLRVRCPEFLSHTLWIFMALTATGSNGTLGAAGVRRAGPQRAA